VVAWRVRKPATANVQAVKPESPKSMTIKKSFFTYLGNLQLKRYLSTGTVLTWLLVLVYMLLFIIISVGQHRALGSHTYDLVNMDQAVWNTLQGRPLAFSIVPGVDSRLAFHFEPILLPISLFYLIYENAETLLLLQTIIVALGAWPVYWIARDKLNSQLAGVTFAWLYLMYPPLQAANVFDFHAVTLAAPFLLFAIHAILNGHRGRAIFFCILAMGCKEDIPLLVVMLGLWVLVFNRDKRLGFVLAGLGMVWFVIAFQIVIPHYAPAGINPYMTRYSEWGSSQREILINLVTNPAGLFKYLLRPTHLTYYKDLLFPLNFLSLLAPHWLLLSGPSLAINLLSNQLAQKVANQFHYTAPIVPFVITAAIFGTSRLISLIPKDRSSLRSGILSFVLVSMIGTTVYQQYYYGYTPLAYTFSWPQITEHVRIGHTLLAQIPADAIVSAQSDLGPQISHREHIYLFPRVDDADFVVLDVTSTIYPMVNYEQYWQEVMGVLAQDFGVVHSQDGYLILKRGEENKVISTDFYTFALLEESVEPEYKVMADFEPGIHLLGFDTRQIRNRWVHLVSYWLLTEPVTEELNVELFIRDSNKSVVASQLPHTTYWLSISEWPAGQVVAVDFGYVNLSLWPQTHLSFAVFERSDTGDRHYLPPQSGNSFLLPMLAGDGHGVRLISYCQHRTVLFQCHDTLLDSLPAGVQQVSYELGKRQFALLAYEINQEHFTPGEAITLKLYWQGQSPIDQDYAFFTHLTGEEPWQIWGQHDKDSRLDSYPTSWWVPNMIVPDIYYIPLAEDMIPGNYRLRVGIYEPSTGDRLPVWNSRHGEWIGDHIDLAEIRIQSR
jgi:uncharacterized membrane protein